MKLIDYLNELDFQFATYVLRSDPRGSSKVPLPPDRHMALVSIPITRRDGYGIYKGSIYYDLNAHEYMISVARYDEAQDFVAVETYNNSQDLCDKYELIDPMAEPSVQALIQHLTDLGFQTNPPEYHYMKYNIVNNMVEFSAKREEVTVKCKSFMYHELDPYHTKISILHKNRVVTHLTVKYHCLAPEDSKRDLECFKTELNKVLVITDRLSVECAGEVLKLSSGMQRKLISNVPKYTKYTYAYKGKRWVFVFVRPNDNLNLSSEWMRQYAILIPELNVHVVPLCRVELMGVLGMVNCTQLAYVKG